MNSDGWEATRSTEHLGEDAFQNLIFVLYPFYVNGMH